MSRAIHAWLQVHLGAHVDLLTGYPFKSAQYTDTPDDIMLLRGDNVAQGSLRWERAKRWPIGQTAEFEKYRLRAGDVILAMDRPWIPAGLKYAWIKRADRPSLLVQRVARMRGTNGLSTDYLRYLIGSPQFTDHVMSIITGVNVPHISARDIKAFRFRLPPVENQRRIAAILSAYDDLIGNNTRRIAILEEMARRLYEEWFVHFRFPGHEGVKIVESEIGAVPEGWTVKTVQDAFEILGGGTPSKQVDEYWQGGDISWYTPTDLTKSGDIFMDRSGMQITELGLKKSSARLFPPFSVMMTSRATLGVIAINTTEASTNQGFITCLPNDEVPLYTLYHWLKANVEQFISLGTGATFKEITKGVFKTVQLAVPTSEIVQEFESKVGPMMGLVLRLQRKNMNLRAQRDLLLPKLISGGIDVSEIGGPIAEVAAE